MTEPFVSVIISTYNRPRYLRQAIASVLSQTLTDFEVLVCDDASPASANVAAIIPDDVRFKHLPSSNNLGTAANNARGYEVAQGRYVAHLDDDDLWTPDYLRRLVAALEARPDCSLAFCNHLILNVSGEPDLRATQRGEEKWGRADLTEGVYQPFWDLAVLRRAIPTSHASVIRRNVLNDLSGLPAAGYAWDLFLTYQAARRGQGAYFIPERLSRYRIHGNQQCAPTTHVESYQGLVYCDRIFLADSEFDADSSVISARLARVTAYWPIALLRLRRRDEARALLRGVRFSLWGAAAQVLTSIPGGWAAARSASGIVSVLRRIRLNLLWRKIMRCLVTGGCGFVGSALVRRLLGDGNEVVAVDDLSSGSSENLGDDRDKVKVIEQDIVTCLAPVIASFQPDVVFHLAALHFIPDCDADAARCLSVNVDGTRSVLEAMVPLRGKVSLVMASSAAVYGPSSKALEEEDELAPVDVYGYSKRWTEEMATSFANDTRTGVGIARLFNVFGPGETNPHFIPSLISQLQAGGPIRLGNLSSKRDYVFVDDVADALLRLAQYCGDGHSVTVNVGSGRAYAGHEVVEALANFGSDPLGSDPIVDPDRLRPVDRPLLLADATLIQKIVGWAPQTSLLEGLRAAWERPMGAGVTVS